MAYTYDAAGFADSRDGVPIEWTAAGQMASYDAYEAEWDMQGQPLPSPLPPTTAARAQQWVAQLIRMDFTCLVAAMMVS